MAETFKKSDFIDEIASEANVTKVRARELLDMFQYIITDKVEAGLTVCLDRLGRFKNTVKPARTARNPQTGAKIQIAEKTVLTFKRKK